MPKGIYPRKLKPITLCRAPGCQRRCECPATGMCVTHHCRFVRNGSLDYVHAPQGTKCAIPGCRKKPLTKQLCSAHYTLNSRYNDPLHERRMRPETCAKISATLKSHSVHPPRNTLPERISKAKCKPNNLEKRLISLIEAHNLPYKYVGDGQVILGGKCPDFINTNGQKIVLEVFGRYWHDPVKNPAVKLKQQEDYIVAHYAKYGFKCIILWGEEVQRKSIIRNLKSKGG